MNLKNINNLFFFIVILVFIFSCSKNELINTETDSEILEKIDFIDNINYNQLRKSLDYYNRDINVSWQDSIKLKKIYNLSFGKTDTLVSNPSNFIISNNYIFYIDNKSNFIKLDFVEKKKIFEVKLLEEKLLDLSFPVTLVKNNSFFYIGFGNGTIIKIDEKGNQYWEKNYKDLLRTPLRIKNDNILALFNSGKIISIDSNSGNTLWEYNYKLNKPSLSGGGQIYVKHNLIYFIMPNGRIGVIDDIVGEPLNNNFMSNIVQKNILNFNYEVKLHIHKELLFLIEDNNIINSYDVNNEEFLLFNEKIYSLKSSNFLSNSLLTLDKNNYLKSYNLKNLNSFWQIDLSKFLSKNDLIVSSYIINDFILIFFSTGKFIQINKFSGEILFKQDLNLKDVNLVSFNENYFILNQNNGKIFFYKQ